MEISKDFKEWLSQYGHDYSERNTVERREYISSTNLFDGKTLSEVILSAKALMAEYGDVTYEEHWTGYEDMSPSLVWYAEETDEEYSDRIEGLHNTYLKQCAEEKKRKEREKLEEEMKAIQNKLNALK
jgi:hypothetical protein